MTFEVYLESVSDKSHSRKKTKTYETQERYGNEGCVQQSKNISKRKLNSHQAKQTVAEQPKLIESKSRDKVVIRKCTYGSL